MLLAYNCVIELLWKMNFFVTLPMLTGVVLIPVKKCPQLVSIEMKSDGLDCFSNKTFHFYLLSIYEYTMSLHLN